MTEPDMARAMRVIDFEELYRATAPELYAYLRRRGAIDPEDLVAEIYVIAWRRRSELPAPLLRRAWLFGAARRLLLAQSRQRGREQEALRCVDPVGESAESRGGRLLEETVAAALNRLSPEERELIRLVEWEQLTPAEIAVAFNIRPGTARVRVHRARQSLAADPDLRALIAQRGHVAMQRVTPRDR